MCYCCRAKDTEIPQGNSPLSRKLEESYSYFPPPRAKSGSEDYRYTSKAVHHVLLPCSMRHEITCRRDGFPPTARCRAFNDEVLGGGGFKVHNDSRKTFHTAVVARSGTQQSDPQEWESRSYPRQPAIDLSASRRTSSFSPPPGHPSFLGRMRKRKTRGGTVRDERTKRVRKGDLTPLQSSLPTV